MPRLAENNTLAPINNLGNAGDFSKSFGRLLIQDGRRWLNFSDPIQIIEAREADQIVPALSALDKAVTEHGLYAAGFISYEAAAAFNLVVHQPDPHGLPLLWFGLYDRLFESSGPLTSDSAGESYQLGKWRPSIEKQAYIKAVQAIKEHIAGADTYQVNYTMHLRTQFSGDPWAFYCDLVKTQRADYTAYLDVGDHVVCSASPELFFRLEGNNLTSLPMKGTAVRGRTLVEDQQQIADLHASIKNRAENVMIVDMIRNDFGRIADIGSVKVPHLFTVEKYPTLLQMTSTVTANSMAALPEIMEAVFPCASITGAPKVRTMQIINALEPQPRGIYTGTIGYWGPGRQAQFNVAIRTAVINRSSGLAEYGVGSGIVWDSDAESEYDECRLKAQVLSRRWPDFDLLESLLWTPNKGYFLLDRHLTRLAKSAVYFDIPFDEHRIRLHLEDLSRGLKGSHKVRILLDSDGYLKSQAISLESNAIVEPVRLGLAEKAVDSSEIWLYHKTTHRQVYEEASASRPDCDDVILWNESGELCEASSSNIVLDLDGRLVTPPIDSGLLAGTFRQQLLEQGRIIERVVTIADLQRCKQLFLINSVRRWRTARLIDTNFQTLKKG